MTTRPEMTPRERVMATLDLQEPDRVPIDLAQAGGDGITAAAYQRLVNHLKLPPREGRIMNKMAQSVHVEEDVLQRFRVDFRRLDLGAPDNWQDEPVGDDGYRDEWGVVRVRPRGSYYYDLAESPMTDDTLDAIDRYPWPDPEDPGRYRGLRERARELHEETDYAVVLNANCAFFLRCAELRGWENFYVDMAGNPEFACALMARYLDIRLRMAERALEEVGEHIDIVFATSDDLGQGVGSVKRLDRHPEESLIIAQACCIMYPKRGGCTIDDAVYAIGRCQGHDLLARSRADGANFKTASKAISNVTTGNIPTGRSARWGFLLPARQRFPAHAFSPAPQPGPESLDFPGKQPFICRCRANCESRQDRTDWKRLNKAAGGALWTVLRLRW